MPSLLTRFRRRLHLRTPPPAPRQPQERDVAFYNDRFTRKTAYQVPYRLSPYYPVSTVIADRIHCAGATSVLEVGCGAGQLAALLMDNGLEQYVGLDFSPTAIALARMNVPRGELHVADALTTDLYTTRSYDLLLCTEVLEHLERDLDLIGRWPSGTRCLCSVPDFSAAGHVRYFDSPAAVRTRYEEAFADLDIVTIRKPNEKPGRYFLFAGVRR